MGNLEHLYIIGNGFDIFTGLKTKYSDFRRWLENKYIFVYEAMTSIYNANGEWWNDFENQLGHLDINKYVEKYPPQDKKLSELLEEYLDTEDPLEKGDGLPHFYEDSPSADRLEGLLDILQYCFEKWVQYEQNCCPCKYTHIEKEKSFFINFNYTDTLEVLYHIPEDHVLHIHGRASKHEHLIFGHDKSSLSYNANNNDERKIADVLSQYEKNPYQYIHQYKLHERINNNIEHIHILGFSFSDIDTPYLEWIATHTSRNCNWEVSWHSEEDQKRINNFLLGYPHLKTRLKLIQINEIEDCKINSQNYTFQIKLVP